MKHRLRSKSWLCFQARSGDDDSSDFYNNNNNMQSVASENSLSDMSTTSSTRSRKRFSSRRTISKIIKAVVLLETSRKKSKKVGQDPYQALTAIPGKKHRKEVEDGSISIPRSSKDSGAVSNTSYSTSSSISCSSTSCSSSSSSSLNLSNLSEQRKSFQSNSFESHESDMIKRPYSSINGLVLLVITLIVLVFWGRICAVICTSTWIYFGPVQRGREDEVTLTNSKHHDEEEMKSKEYKKRVIMGGFLERKRSRI